ncbi:MAG TPA: pseudouridine-5'-phosphate glycosidase [Thermoanaerobaculia bacterium]|nr:pseudouridine-5'-phosphate glycosidase [Thermoanaerobaculia bacterium]
MSPSPAPDLLAIHPEVRAALEAVRPVVALESTVISHGLPRPENLELAREMEAIVRAEGAVPATTAILSGQVRAGLEDSDLEHLAGSPDVWKASRRDFPVLMAQRRDGATTVAGAMIAAHWAGVRVLATGGIGGVHRGRAGDVSADLPELARTPVLVVCAGAKAILDLPATLEWLETYGVPVVGYQTDELPAFYTRRSGLDLHARADSPDEAAAIVQALWASGFQSGMLVCVPCPEEAALPRAEIESAIARAVDEAEAQGVHGKALTPFLLARVADLTEGRSKTANLALLRNNARVAARIAGALL